jgi:FLYWCH zinc finger domain
MLDSRFDMSNKSCDANDEQSQCSLKIVESHSVNNFSAFDFQSETSHISETPIKAPNSPTEIPNEVSASGSSITMLSSTSLLHGNCIFNRNNTVATQAGLKTYWLCKSYRISMCKARCITHQVRQVVSRSRASLNEYFSIQGQSNFSYWCSQPPATHEQQTSRDSTRAHAKRLRSERPQRVCHEFQLRAVPSFLHTPPKWTDHEPTALSVYTSPDAHQSPAPATSHVDAQRYQNIPWKLSITLQSRADLVKES